MNEQVSMMNQHQQQQLKIQPQSMVVTALTQPPPPQPITQQHLQHSQLPQMLMNPPPPPQQPQQMMMNRNYGMWPPPPAGPMDRHQPNFRKPNTNSHLLVGLSGGSGYVSGGKPLGPRNNWKGKKANNNNKRRDFGRRMEGPAVPIGGASGSVAVAVGNTIIGGVGGGGYKPPTLNELQHQNRVKARRFFPKKNFNNKSNNFNRGKFAPRNTSSFIIRAKKSGGITELVSPCAVTPAVLPTPMFSPSREVLMDMAKEEWGVDGYGSMKGLIRLRPAGGQDAIEGQEEEESDEGGSSGSDVEEHVEVERRLDHDLSRFEMIYPNYGAAGGMEHNNILENRVDDQDSHIAQLEEENLILKERLFLMEREFGDLRRRMQFLERRNRGEEDINEEVEENESDNDSDSNEDVHSLGVHQVEEINNGEMVDEIDEGDGDVDATSIEEKYSVQGIEGIKKEEEKIVEQLDNTDKAKFKVVELKEQIYGIDLVDDGNVKEKNNNKSSSEMVEERCMSMNDTVIVAPVGEEMITEDEKDY